MDVNKIFEDIAKNAKEISDEGYSFIAASFNKEHNMCMCTVGTLLDQVRILASTFVTIKSAVKSKGCSEKNWELLWQKALGEAGLNRLLNNKTEGNKDND